VADAGAPRPLPVRPGGVTKRSDGDTVHARRVGAPDRGDAFWLYLIGLTLPFPEVGLRLNELFVLSATTLVALVFAAKRFAREGAKPTHVAGAAMLALFISTAVWRHPPSSYVLSIGALALAMLPLATTRLTPYEARTWVAGFLAGLWITVAWSGLTIWIQLVGIGDAFTGTGEFLIGPDHFGSFWGYRRPAAGFSEPSHLAIYLAVSYVVLDLLAAARRRTGLARLIVAIALICTGSVSGVVALFIYLTVAGIITIRRFMVQGLSRAWLLRGMLVAYALAGGVWYLVGSGLDFTDEYSTRLLSAAQAIQSQDLVGSEASRANAMLALPAFWASSGFAGFLMGTGYANHQAWLIANFGYLHEWATFSRGHVDSILVAVFLSTGLLGMLAYLWALMKLFGRDVVVAFLPLVSFILALNFVFGFLISGLYWQWLFMLAVAARLAMNSRPKQSTRRTVRRPSTRIRPMQA
jgi:hypothetical protein